MGAVDHMAELTMFKILAIIKEAMKCVIHLLCFEKNKYIYIYVYIYMYIYIYVCIYIYVYIYIYV